MSKYGRVKYNVLIIIFSICSEVYFKDLSILKSVPIRDVKAVDIGKLVSVRGKENIRYISRFTVHVLFVNNGNIISQIPEYI